MQISQYILRYLLKYEDNYLLLNTQTYTNTHTHNHIHLPSSWTSLLGISFGTIWTEQLISCTLFIFIFNTRNINYIYYYIQKANNIKDFYIYT